MAIEYPPRAGDKTPAGMKQAGAGERRDHVFAILVALVFLAAGGAAAWHHELWRDEVQAWLIARDNASLSDMIRFMRYDGHPCLWYLCLWIAAKVTHALAAVQVLHLTIAASTVYLFARVSPFSRVQKALFAFGYFPMFEYSVLCRNYAPGVFLLVAFCCLFPKRDKAFLWISVILFFLANTIAHMLIVTIVIAAVLAFDMALRRKASEGGCECPAWKRAAGFTIIGAGILLSVLQVIPPPDGGFARLWTWGIDFRMMGQTVSTVARAYFPVPQVQCHFWISPLFPEKFPLFLRFESWFALALVCGTAFVLSRKPVVLAFYLGGTLALWLFFYTKYFGFLRHHGFLFILFVASAWLYWIGPPPPRPRTIFERWSAAAEKWFRPAVTVLFGIHVAGAAIALSMDCRHPFSHGKTVAEYIIRENMRDRLMAGHMDSNAVSVLGYLDGKKMFYPQALGFGSFVVMNLKHNPAVCDSTIVERVKDLAVRSKQDVLFIVHYPLSFSDPCIKPVKEFTGSIVQDEDFYLYEVRHPF
jgi:hypothetical protein